MFFANSFGVLPLPKAFFPPGPGLVSLHTQGSHEGVFILRVAAIAIFASAILSGLAWIGPRPVPLSVLATLLFYHAAALCVCGFMPLSAKAFDGDLGGLITHGLLLSMFVLSLLDHKGPDTAKKNP